MGAPKEFANALEAFVKATNLDDAPPKEKHVKFLLALVADRGREKDAVFVIEAVAKTIRKCSHWRTMLKTHALLHRLLMESGVEFRMEFFKYCDGLSRNPTGPKEQMLFNISYWKDELTPDSPDLAGWTRSYAIYLEEICSLHAYVPQLFFKERNQTSALRSCDLDQLLKIMPLLQTLVRRMMECEPRTAATKANAVIRFTLSLILRDSFKVYYVMNESIINLVDRYFESTKAQATRGLMIFKKYMLQINELQRFYRVCEEVGAFEQSGPLDFELDSPPPAFLASMEEYCNNAPLDGVPNRERRMLGPSASVARASPPSVVVPRTNLLPSATPSPSSLLDTFGEFNVNAPALPSPSRSSQVDFFGSNALPAPGSASARQTMSEGMPQQSPQPAAASNALDFFSMPTSAPAALPPVAAARQALAPSSMMMPPQSPQSSSDFFNTPTAVTPPPQAAAGRFSGQAANALMLPNQSPQPEAATSSFDFLSAPAPQAIARQMQQPAAATSSFDFLSAPTPAPATPKFAQQQQGEPSRGGDNPFGDNPFGRPAPAAREINKEALADLYARAPSTPNLASSPAPLGQANFAQNSLALTPSRALPGAQPIMALPMPGMQYPPQLALPMPGMQYPPQQSPYGQYGQPMPGVMSMPGMQYPSQQSPNGQYGQPLQGAMQSPGAMQMPGAMSAPGMYQQSAVPNQVPYQPTYAAVNVQYGASQRGAMQMPGATSAPGMNQQLAVPNQVPYQPTYAATNVQYGAPQRSPSNASNSFI